ncbi:hypothetical protein HC776_02900, partial [bacterium]|nr:hypothetical protein [bacterium]
VRPGNDSGRCESIRQNSWYTALGGAQLVRHPRMGATLIVGLSGKPVIRFLQARFHSWRVKPSKRSIIGSKRWRMRMRAIIFTLNET